ncbi:assimilatory sulfite reductase (NADPH) hemoprotein subunit [Marilutibacter alkalisoli]|uniref:Sulfite reductase [NADPH] hemoprotein beta-component n=1 Tax=Marilutibacter alkalisoli TaxID=2591633 RepID=A0A514BPQ1_9GAMM|nr:assimilatory sulfite reductase (NADPH) hemoprotein subunit [Lysobacter alkalisoli]QDH69362.1 assimilatory sulfite reductase (NADPH) hemoprotein subunit [Lysobacter alkalisoli]
MSAHSVEDIKRASAGLRGSLLQSLADPLTGSLREDDQTLIKYHGSYQQDDRDIREERRVAKLEPAYSFMIRTRTPGGVVTPEQWLKLDHIATTFAERGLRITTRQAFQFHGVIKTELKSTMQAINAALIDTLAACGDVNRNVAVSANPLQSRTHAAVYAHAAAVSEHLLPNTRAYYEIWLDEEQVAGSPDVSEPVYGETYLPRKFKIGFAIPPYNDVDVFAQDLGFIAVIDSDSVENDGVVGYNVVIGGGMGATHGDAETYPRLANVIGFIPVEALKDVATAVVTTQRDWGNREVRKRARLKYTIDDHGLDNFKAEVEKRAGIAFEPARPWVFEHNNDRFGWVQSDGNGGEDGRWHLTLALPAGRIVDNDTTDNGRVRHLSGLREIARLLQDSTLQEHGEGAEFRMTANQNLVIAGVPADKRKAVDALVAVYALDIHRSASPLQRDAIACVALPTCGLAMAEAERYLPELAAKIDALLAKHGLADAPINLRISGCPNGCSRPYLGEIALVGKAPGRYNLMLGADHRGQRLNTLHRENIDEAAILAELDSLFARYAGERRADEGFGDFIVRNDVVTYQHPSHYEVTP